MPLIGRDPELASHLRSLGASLRKRGGIKSILCISAHWEEKVPTVQTRSRPPLYFDYYNFPVETYKYEYDCGLASATSKRASSLLAEAGFECRGDGKRGFDHGTFVPLMLMFPKADIPVAQLSLVQGLDPKMHYAIGRALAPLRADGVLIIGSGMSYHGFGHKGVSPSKASKAFDAYLQSTLSKDGAERAARLGAWEKAEHARAAHGREEHLIPLMVAAGAAHKDKAVSIFHTENGMGHGITLSSFQFGL